MSRISDPDDFDGCFQCKFVVNASKDVVYESFIDHIWYKNAPFFVAPSKLIETDLSDDLKIQYSQRSLVCKLFLETIYDAKQNEYIKYYVSSYLMPTSHYESYFQLEDYYDKKTKTKSTLITWSANFIFRWNFINYCCPFIAVFFRKMQETFIHWMANSLIKHIQQKKQK